MRYIAKSGERLDDVVYRHYRSLEFFEQVLALNARLNIILTAGDIVILPEFKRTLKSNKLW